MLYKSHQARRRLSAALAVAAALGLATSPGLSQDSQLAERGQAVFQNWCAACHAPGPGHPGTQALTALYRGQKPGALEQRSDLLPEVTRAFVRTGAAVMPPFRKTEIPDADLDALAAYLAPQD